MAQETKIGFSLGGFFCWVLLLGFLGGFTPKKPAGFFWVSTRASEPWWSLLCYTQVLVLVWVLASLAANMIGHWILGAFLGIVLTLLTRDSDLNNPIRQ